MSIKGNDTSDMNEDWYKTFDWKVGAKLEAFTEHDWWEVVVVRVDRDRAKIHYVGGGEEEDEWILKSSNRFRPSQSLTRKSISSSKSNPTRHDARTNTIPAAEVSTDEGSQRPHRKSRMLSDDARLALQLQEEELKSSRGLKAAARKRSPPRTPAVETANKVAKHITTSSQAAKSQSGKGPGRPPGHHVESTSAPGSRQHSAAATEDRTKQTYLPSRTQPSPSKTPSSIKARHTKDLPSRADREGIVSFTVIPEQSGSDALPSLRRSHMSWSEDVTVFHIKKQIVEEVCPEMTAAQIDIRTPSGILLGQDHCLKFVRTILWPPSKGELILKYSRGKTLLL